MRGPQSLLSLRVRRDYEPALLTCTTNKISINVVVVLIEKISVNTSITEHHLECVANTVS